MTALITSLIDTSDNFELIRDQIAAVIKLEAANQEVLAVAADEDPKLWRLRVFVERSNPWEAYLDAPPDDVEGDDRHVPIVSVRFDTDSIGERASNQVSRQKYSGAFNVDCYGYGRSKSEDSGHTPGDLKAATECHRAMRLVRQILMAGHYTYLGFPRGANQVVWKRQIQTRTVFQPQLGTQPVGHVVGGRLALQVDYSEFAPQVEGQPLELIAASVERDDSGEVHLLASFGLQPETAVVAANGLTIALTYYDTLSAASVAAATDYLLHDIGPTVTGVAVAGSTVTLTVDSPIVEGETVLLDYIPGVNPIEFDGANGNAVADLHQFAVTNNSTVTP
jgi:hypothetical protein